MLKSYAYPPKTFTAEDIAQFDMIQSWFWYKDKIIKAHMINPDFIALLYRNPTGSEHGSVYAPPDQFILRYADNTPVKSRIYPTMVYYDFGNPEYQQWLANWIVAQGAEWDGVFLDVSLSATRGEHFWFTERREQNEYPINPRTGFEWIDIEVRDALVELHIAVKSAIGDKLLACNGIFSGVRYWKDEDFLNDVIARSPMDGFMSEGCWCPYGGSPTTIRKMSSSEWLDTVRFVERVQDWLMQKPSRFFIPMCKLGVKKMYNLPVNTSWQQLAYFAFASQMLVTKSERNFMGIGWFSMTKALWDSNVKPLFGLNIGQPLENYQIVEDKIAKREFSNGTIIVNPLNTLYSFSVYGKTFRIRDYSGMGVDTAGNIVFGAMPRPPTVSFISVPLSIGVIGIVEGVM